MASSHMPRLTWMARVWRSWWGVKAEAAATPDAADDPADLVAVEGPAVVGGQRLVAADVLEVGRGPGGEELAWASPARRRAPARTSSRPPADSGRPRCGPREHHNHPVRGHRGSVSQLPRVDSGSIWRAAHIQRNTACRTLSLESPPTMPPDRQICAQTIAHLTALTEIHTRRSLEHIYEKPRQIRIRVWLTCS